MLAADIFTLTLETSIEDLVYNELISKLSRIKKSWLIVISGKGCYHGTQAWT